MRACGANVLTGRTAGTLTNQAVYVFDTLKFGERVLLNLGARYERNDGANNTWAVKTYDAEPGADNSGLGEVTARNPDFRNEENLFSWRSGVVYKPAENGTLYLSYSNSNTPSKASVNGACNATTCSVDACRLR